MNNNENKKEFKQVQSMGQLWTKESKSNKKFLSGYITLDKDYKKGDVVYMAVFNNIFKKTERHPDYIIKKSENKTKNANNNNFF